MVQRFHNNFIIDIFQHSEEASSSRLPEIVSPVAVVSTDQVDSEIVSPVAVVSTDQVDSSAPLVDDSFGGARPKTSLSRSDSETSSPVCTIIYIVERFTFILYNGCTF